MTSALLSLLVWLPFLILAVTFGIVFGILGFKRGSIKAAIFPVQPDGETASLWVYEVTAKINGQELSASAQLIFSYTDY